MNRFEQPTDQGVTYEQVFSQDETLFEDLDKLPPKLRNFLIGFLVFSMITLGMSINKSFQEKGKEGFDTDSTINFSVSQELLDEAEELGLSPEEIEYIAKGVKTIRISEGDTLWRIIQEEYDGKYKIDHMAHLIGKINDINPNKVKENQIVALPISGEDSINIAERIIEIKDKYGLSLEKLVEFNIKQGRHEAELEGTYRNLEQFIYNFFLNLLDQYNEDEDEVRYNKDFDLNLDKKTIAKAVQEFEEKRGAPITKLPRPENTMKNGANRINYDKKPYPEGKPNKKP